MLYLTKNHNDKKYVLIDFDKGQGFVYPSLKYINKELEEAKEEKLEIEKTDSSKKKLIRFLNISN